MSGYADWLKQGPTSGMLLTDRERNDLIEQWSRVEPPMGGGIKTVGKKSGLFGWIGRQAGRFGRWTGILSKPQVKTVAEMAATRLVGAGGMEMYRDAVNIVKAFKGTPQQKMDLFEEFAKQISQRTGGSWGAGRVPTTDGAALFVGKAGEAIVINQKGEIFRGSAATGGWKVTTEGYVLLYEALKRIN